MRRGRKALILGCALIAVVNAVVLIGAFKNRELPAESVLALTNRELGISQGGQGLLSTRTVNLWLSYRWLGQGAQVSRIPAERMADLGFRVELGLVNCTLPDGLRRETRKGYLVLEMNGLTYRRSVDAARTAQRQAAARLKAKPHGKDLQEALKEADTALAHEVNEASRLFAVDQGMDRSALRALYSDTTRYALIEAEFRAGVQASDETGQKCRYFASIRPVIQRISVPYTFRHVFADDAESSKWEPRTPVFDARIAWGSRLEPWLVSAQNEQ